MLNFHLHIMLSLVDNFAATYHLSHDFGNRPTSINTVKETKYLIAVPVYVY